MTVDWWHRRSRWRDDPEAAPATSRWLGRRMRSFVGIRQEDIDDFPADQAWYTRMVVLVLLVATLAAISMANALLFTLGPEAIVRSMVFGVLWGGTVLAIDLAILAPGDGRATIVKTVLRLMLAGVLGIVISAPLLATLFRRDVDGAEHQRFVEEVLPAHEASRQGAMVAAGEEADVAVTAARDAWQQLHDVDVPDQRKRVDDLRDQCFGEYYSGGTSGVAGSGPVTDAICDDYRTAQTDLTTLVTDESAALDELRAAEDGRTAAVFEAVVEWDGLHPTPVYDKDALGVWDRIERTHEHLGWASWLAAGALVLVDCLVVLFKVIKGVSTYEAHMTGIQDAAAVRQNLEDESRVGAARIHAGEQVRVAQARAQLKAEADISVERERFAVDELYRRQDVWDDAEADGLDPAFVNHVLHGHPLPPRRLRRRSRHGDTDPRPGPVHDDIDNPRRGSGDASSVVYLRDEDSAGWRDDLLNQRRFVIRGWEPENVPIEAEAMIGDGGDGEVFRVRRGRHRYAIKVPTHGGPDNIAREVKVYDGLPRDKRQLFPRMEFPNEAASANCLVLEYYPRQSLDRYYHAQSATLRRPWLAPVTILNWLVQLRVGLFVLWDMGIVHCDGKASNILITGDDRSDGPTDGRLLIADLARAARFDEMREPGPSGWAPPECSHDTAVAATVARDVFSMLGGVAYFCVSGGRYPNDTHGEWLRHRQGRPRTHQLVDGCPPALAQLIDVWLADRPEHRFVVPGGTDPAPSFAEITSDIAQMKARLDKQIIWLREQLERDPAFRKPLFGICHPDAPRPRQPHPYDYGDQRGSA